MVIAPKAKTSTFVGKSRLTSTGQVTIPADIRRELSADSGDTVVFGRNSDGEITIRVPRTARQLAGSFGPRPENLDEILEEARGYVRRPYRYDSGSGDDLS